MTASSVTTSKASKDISTQPGLMNRLRYIGITGIIAAVVFSVAGWVLVMEEGNNGSVAAAIGILFMTAPVSAHLLVKAALALDPSARPPAPAGGVEPPRSNGAA